MLFFQYALYLGTEIEKMLVAWDNDTVTFILCSIYNMWCTTYRSYDMCTVRGCCNIVGKKLPKLPNVHKSVTKGTRCLGFSTLSEIVQCERYICFNLLEFETFKK